MPPLPLISVIIPAYNEAAHLQSCLESVKSQTYPRLEIIVIDDGSKDQTPAIAKSFNLVKLLRQLHRGPGSARNRAAQAAKGSILVFVDADMILDPKFVSLLTAPIRQGKTLGTTSLDEYVANWDNPWARSWSQLRGFAKGRMHSELSVKTHPVFRAITKSAFQKAGGFALNRGYDDDWSLAENLGSQALVVPFAKVYHHNPASLEEIFTQSIWMGMRRYKYGILGKIIALVRSSLPFSLIRSIYLSVQHQSFTLFLTGLVYDLGLSLGIIKSLTRLPKAR